MKKILYSLTLVTIICLIPICADAQLLMEQSRFEETANPGETLVDSVTLHNTSTTAMELNVYWEDFDYIPPFDGKKDFQPTGTSKYSMGNWITYSPQELTIPPKSKREINFTIKVPESASGGYYGVLFFESGSRRRTESTGVSIVTRLGSLFFLEISDKNKTSSIKDVVLKDGSIEGVVSNKGNIILFPKGVYYIMDKEGLIIERDELNKIYLPPNEEGPFSITPSKDLATGSYNMVLTFDLGEGDSLVKEIDFTKKSDSSLMITQMRD